MSAWYIISALGFYAVDPVSGNYVFGSPLVDQAEVDLGNGKNLRIEVKRKSPGDAYIQAISFNGKPYERLSFKHADIANGAVLEFTMGPQPSQFGRGDSAIPPSMSTIAS